MAGWLSLWKIRVLLAQVFFFLLVKTKVLSMTDKNSLGLLELSKVQEILTALTVTAAPELTLLSLSCA